jgi:hypothetical protein
MARIAITALNELLLLWKHLCTYKATTMQGTTSVELHRRHDCRQHLRNAQHLLAKQQRCRAPPWRNKARL